jgi:peptide/nickel transport system permease protein
MTFATLADQTSEVVLAAPTARKRLLRPGVISLTIGGVVIGIVYLAALFLPLPYDPLAVDTSAILQPPSSAHWMGTDGVGGDILSRTIAAGRVDLSLSLLGTLLSLVLGVAGGLLASTRSVWAERFMRALDAFQALPLLIVTLALVTLSGNSIWMVALAMVMICGPLFVRLVRSQALAVRESRFVEASLAAGSGWGRIMFRHVLPNIRPLILAQTAQVAGVGLLLVAALSFLGIGVQPPTPTWGGIIKTGASQVVLGNWWIVAAPGLAIFLCVLSFNLIADGLRDTLSGRKRKGA